MAPSRADTYWVQKVLGQATASRARPGAKERTEMNNPSIHTALARERQETMLAEARAAHRAREARAYRRGQRERSSRRQPFRRATGWLAPAWRRLLTPQSASAAAALQRVVPRGQAAPAGRDTGAVGAEPAAAEHAGLAASPR